jgi:hypothetical protein
MLCFTGHDPFLDPEPNDTLDLLCVQVLLATRLAVVGPDCGLAFPGWSFGFSGVLQEQIPEEELAEILQAFFSHVHRGRSVDDRTEAYKRARVDLGRLATRISRYIVVVRFSEETQSPRKVSPQ